MTALSDGVLSVEQRDRVTYVRAREAQPTSVSAARIGRALVDVFEEVSLADFPPSAVALVGSGAAFFLLPPQDETDCDAYGELGPAIESLSALNCPTVAAIGADAVGAAFAIALACDVRLLSSAACVGSPEVIWGRLPVAGAVQRLARVAGPATALRLLLEADLVDSETALGLRLVQSVVAPELIEERLESILGSIRRGASQAAAYAKEAVLAGAEMTLLDGLRLEADLSALLQTTADRAEGIRSFLERRAPHYEGR